MFVFRCMLGLRHADSYSTSAGPRTRTKSSGATDDVSVDLAFYSGDELDVDSEETKKERKMRRKTPEKKRIVVDDFKISI